MVAGVELITTPSGADSSHFPKESDGGTAKARFVALVGLAVIGIVVGESLVRFVAVNCTAVPKVRLLATSVTVSPRNAGTGLAGVGVLGVAGPGASAPRTLAIAKNAHISNLIAAPRVAADCE